MKLPLCARSVRNTFASELNYVLYAITELRDTLLLMEGNIFEFNK
uniref:Uncharacterized protein n=1 Tax=Ralstonia solanacearum TaxID=305 RepID=A0A0S4UWD0_RALSL|nr:protein of unknown function [Ralstonia solanacearum]CUV37405.1 protein of unknown function [Ralstonia solanacearum]CUV42617.1 protein of unknown function [Ralstonia solanacearum]CUV57870.1 protein of unknown function [Ralstonia solanacearum]CUV63781.1 protein of unknown function [Ralstonia solanacearum]